MQGKTLQKLLDCVREAFDCSDDFHFFVHENSITVTNFYNDRTDYSYSIQLINIDETAIIVRVSEHYCYNNQTFDTIETCNKSHTCSSKCFCSEKHLRSITSTIRMLLLDILPLVST